MARTYLTLVVLFGMLGAMVSTFSSRAGFGRYSSHASIAPVESNTGSEQESYDAQSNSDSDALEIPRSRDGHFYADVEINGEPVHMLVDTGASAIALSQDDASSAGVVGASDGDQVVGRGADGDVRGQIVRLDRVELGDTSAEGLHAVILSKGEQSLLGQNFLSKFSSVDIEGNTMVLR